MLQFDAATAALLDSAYRGRDFAARRRANLDALAPRPGDRVIDIGCGTGLLLADLARAVGPEGKVFGIDPSAEMLDAARRDCGGLDAVEIIEGTAESLPLADGCLDGAVSVQVFEYFDDVAPALAECARVLRPGGRIVVGDMHFGTLVWHSDDPERMARMCAAWDHHLADPAVPARLPGALRAAGFGEVSAASHTFLDIHFRPDGIARMMILLMADFARREALLPEPEIAAWAEEQDALARDGRFFFAFTHIVTSARRV